MQSLKVYRDYAAEQALILFCWLLCHDNVCVSAGALGVSQYVGEGWMPGWRLVTWISLSHCFLALFGPLVVNYCFFDIFFLFSFSVLYVCKSSEIMNFWKLFCALYEVLWSKSLWQTSLGFICFVSEALCWFPPSICG